MGACIVLAFIKVCFWGSFRALVAFKGDFEKSLTPPQPQEKKFAPPWKNSLGFHASWIKGIISTLRFLPVVGHLSPPCAGS